MVDGISFDPAANINAVGLASPVQFNSTAAAKDEFVKIFVSEMLKQGFATEDDSVMNNNQMVDVISEELIQKGYFSQLEQTH